MLRITVTEHASQQRWLLQGKLVKHTLPELISASNTSRNECPERVRVVDLDEITTIDKDGEQLLRLMIDEGAELVANGLYTKHLVEAIRSHRTDLK
jgi:ABC-type transporter Mla MlaB component